MRAFSVITMVMLLCVPVWVSVSGCKGGSGQSSSKGKSGGAKGDGGVSAESVAKALTDAVIGKDVRAAQRLFLSDSMIETLFPGPECEGYRAGSRQEREEIIVDFVLERSVRQAANQLKHGDKFGGDLEEADMEGVTRSLWRIKEYRQRVFPVGHTENGCSFGVELEMKEMVCTLQATKAGKTVEVTYSPEITTFGDHGWYVSGL